MISLSVSERKRVPPAASSARRASWFSTMPLWITATRSLLSTSGCALRSEGWPCVAQRVCPMPVLPKGGRSASTPSSAASLPSRRTTTSPPFDCTATPAES
jgi:hypothetical protein